jgi:mediator of RNA polymerase II transcription subunit 7
MADPQQANALTAAFPNPPPFYHYFSSENLEHLESLKAEAERDGTSREQDAQTTRKDTPTSSPAPQLLELPPHLRCLQPPAEPANGMYRSFGDPFNVSLASCRTIRS